MLKFSMIKPIGGILKRLDVQPMLEEIRKIDIEKEGWQEQAGMLVLSHVVDKIEDAADSVVELCARYKNVPIEEAMEMDAIEVIRELFREPGFADFFKRAAQSAGPK